MSEDRRNKEEDSGDKAIVDALSTFGWIEEKEERQESENQELDFIEQLNLFKEQNNQLNAEIKRKNIEHEDLKTENARINSNKLKLLKEIKELKEIITEKDTIIEELSEKAIDIDEAIRNQSIQELNEELDAKKHEIETQNLKMVEQSNQVQEMVLKVKGLEENIQINQQFTETIQEKTRKIDELTEQIQYLQNDTIHKSKFEKVQNLLEKKDQVITEKEKKLFEFQNSIKELNLKNNSLSSQFETFNLVKKDLRYKEDHISQLKIKNEDLKRKEFSNKELIDRLEMKLAESLKLEGSSSNKHQLEMSNLRNQLNQKEAEIQELNKDQSEIKNKLYETERIEDKILSDYQKAKDENLRFETKLEKTEEELVELKKKIKVMRRDLLKTYKIKKID